MLSFFRLALVPLIVWAYIGLDNCILAIALVALSGITDVVDGKIARKFNMISDFGKVLDPVADKVTQGALILCLASRYKLMIPLIILFVVKEALMLLLGYLVFKKHDSVNSSKWYGKVNTVLLYAMAILLIMFPDIPDLIATSLIALCAGFILFSFIRYALFYRTILKQKD